MNDEMLEAKKRLYHLILKKGDQATESEVNIAFVIMQDPEIQQLFEAACSKDTDDG